MFLELMILKNARQLYKCLNPGDIALGDRAFCAYSDLYFLQKQECDAIFYCIKDEQSSSKKEKDLVLMIATVIWHKPKSCPKGLSKEEFDSLTDHLLLREIHYYICIPGYRTKQVTLITTLLDAQLYPTLELIKIYELRWD